MEAWVPEIAQRQAAVSAVVVLAAPVSVEANPRLATGAASVMSLRRHCRAPCGRPNRWRISKRHRHRFLPGFATTTMLMGKTAAMQQKVRHTYPSPPSKTSEKFALFSS